MADEARFTFEFIDKTGQSPASSKPGSTSGGGASSGVGPSFQEEAGDAAGKAQDRNERATGGDKSKPATVPPSGASSAAGEGNSRSQSGTSGDSVTSSLGALGSSARDFAREASSGNLVGAMRAGRNVVDAARGASLAARIPGMSASGLSMAGDTAATSATTASRVVAGRAAFGAAASAVPGGAAAGGVSAGALAGPLGLLALGAAIPPLVIAGSIRAGGQRADAMRDRVAEFSPEAAAAQAQAEVRQIIADLRSSQRLGPAIARRIDEQSKLAEDIQEIKDIAAKPFIEVGNDLTSILGSLVDVLRQGMEYAEPIYDAAVKIYTFAPFLERIAKHLEKLRDDDDKQFDLLNWFGQQPHIAPPGWGVADNDPLVQGVAFNKVPGLNL